MLNANYYGVTRTFLILKRKALICIGLYSGFINRTKLDVNRGKLNEHYKLDDQSAHRE